MRNYIQEGRTLTVTATEDTASGAFVIVGAIAGIACGAAKAGEELEVKRDGVYAVTVKVGDNPAVGELAYFDVANDRFTKTSAAGLYRVGLFASATEVALDGIAVSAIA